MSSALDQRLSMRRQKNRRRAKTNKKQVLGLCLLFIIIAFANLYQILPTRDSSFKIRVDELTIPQILVTVDGESQLPVIIADNSTVKKSSSKNHSIQEKMKQTNSSKEGYINNGKNEQSSIIRESVQTQEKREVAKEIKSVEETKVQSQEKVKDKLDLFSAKILCGSTRHVHLSLLDEGGMTVSFATGECANGQGAVMYGTSRDGLDQIVISDDVRQYEIFHPKYKSYHSEQQHHVTLRDLKPSTTYYYTCVIIPNDHSKPSRNLKKKKQMEKKMIYSFQSTPLPGEGYGSTMAIFGDVAVRPHSKECMAALSKEKDADVLLLVGDLAYSEGNHHLWDEFMDMMYFTHSKPLQIAAGNHDIEHNSTTGKMFLSYEARFRMPHIQPAQFDNFTEDMAKNDNTVDLPYLYGNSFYSFVYGPSHNIVLNSFAPFAPGSVQYNWLETELLKVDRSITPWLTVTIHCPLYNTFKFHHDDPQLVNAKVQLEPIFIKHRVNFVFSGHVHSYSRSHPVAYDQVSPSGPIHLLLGNGGRQANVPFYNEKPEEWVVIRDHSQYGYGLLKFINATTAHYEWIVTGFNYNKQDKKARFFFPHKENVTDSTYITNQNLL